MILYIQLLVFALLSPQTDSNSNNIDSSSDQQLVEQEVLNWADSAFIQHLNYKFEHFKAHYTDDYFIQTMRIETYDQKIRDLEERKANGTYYDNEENYAADHKKLSDALESARGLINKIDRVTYYETHFWTNVQTTDGITVYYEFIVKLDNNYNVIEALENSSIGKKNRDSKIAYKSDAPEKRVLEK